MSELIPDVFTADELDQLVGRVKDAYPAHRTLYDDEATRIIGWAARRRLDAALLQGVLDGKVGITWDDDAAGPGFILTSGSPGTADEYRALVDALPRRPLTMPTC